MAPEDKIGKLLRLIEIFIAGGDRSLVLAGEIEVSLDEIFTEDDFMQETVVNLALYRPGGGLYLLDEHDIKKDLKIVRKRLSKHTDQDGFPN